MPERFDAYLAAVRAEIRWKRARPVLCRELLTHLEEQKADCLAAGLTEGDAEREAVRQMGDPALVGRELDGVHRPSSQWGLLCLTALLAALGAVLRLTVAGQAAPLWVLACFVLSAGLLLGGYYLDYTVLGRHAGLICLAVFALGFFSFALPNAMYNGRVRLAVYAAQLFPPAAALGVYALRGRGWSGFAAALLLPLPFAVLGWRIPSFPMVLALAAASAAVLSLAVSREWFRVKKPWAFALIAGACLLTIGLAFYILQRNGHLRLIFRPELDAAGAGYPGVALREALRSAALWGPAAEERASVGTAERILTEFLLRFGLIPALLLCTALFSLSALTLIRCLRQQNALGSVLALSAAISIGVRLLLNLMAFAGFVLYESDCPFLSGSFHSVIDMALMGLALSVFRQGTLPEPCRTPGKTPDEARPAP